MRGENLDFSVWAGPQLDAWASEVHPGDPLLDDAALRLKESEERCCIQGVIARVGT